MRSILLLLPLLILTVTTSGQHLFTYGGKKVTEQEFLHSFNRNNTDTGNTRKAMQDYLELYIRYKLKVQAAKDLKMDTLPNQKADLASFEEQLSPLYLLDQQTLDSLTRQAFERSMVEISVAHIFFSKEKVAAQERALQAMKSLKEGHSFAALAASATDDQETAAKGGSLGYITVFTLPYAFESAIYALKDGEHTDLMESNAGYHIFRRLATKALNSKRSYRHMLIAVPENLPETEKAPFRALATNLRDSILAGVSFDSLARRHSDDKTSAALGGRMEKIPAGTYEIRFEEEANSLRNKGDLSPVFNTAFGFHLLQLDEEVPVSKDLQAVANEWKDIVLQDERKEIAAKEMIRKNIGKHGLTLNTPNKEAYIAKRLSLFSAPYANLVNDFRDGNLLFEVMDKKIWGKAASDLEGLKKFHAGRKDQYQWKHSVFAYTFTFQQKEDAEAFRNKYLASPSLSNLLSTMPEGTFADSGRYEAADLQGVGIEQARAGFVSQLFSNIADGSFSFHVIIKKFNDPGIKTFEEARGAVVNDYQTYLEDNWINSLKKKYPVVIDQANWKKLLEKTN